MSGATSILDSLPTVGAPPPPAAKVQTEGGVPTITVRSSSSNNATSILDSLPAVEMPAPTHPARTGLFPQLWQGVREGAASLGNAAYSSIVGPFGNTAYQDITGTGSPPMFKAGEFQAPQGMAETAARVIGQGLPTIPLMAAGAAAGAPTLGRAALEAGRSVLTTTLPIAGGQIAGEAAAELAPEPWKGLAGFGGTLAGGAVTAGGQASAGMLTRGTGRAASGAGMWPIPKQTFQAPGGEAVRATEQQTQQARARLAGAAEQSGPGGAEQFQTLLNTAPGEIVPGSQPTTAQMAPLPGIAKLEDTVKAGGAGPAFMARAEQQNTARVGAIGALRPEADSAAVGQLFRDQLTALDQAGEAQIGAARGNVQGATEAMGGRGAPAAYGQEMRGAIQGALDPVQVQRRALWNAVDPDGTLALDAAPVRDAARGLLQQITPSDTLTAQERGALDHAGGLGGVVPFSELQTLRSNILSAQRSTMAGEPLTTRGMGRLNALKSAVDEAMAAAAEQKAAQEAQAVASGAMSPEQTMMARLNAAADQNGTGTSPGHRDQVLGGDQRPGQTAGVSPGAGYPNAQGQGEGLGGSNRSVAPAPAIGGRGRAPESLVDFLISRGGVRDPGGDLKAIGADTIHHQKGGRLVNPNGLEQDYAREAAVEAGFLGPNAMINDLKDAIAEHVSGRPVYRISEQAEGDLRARDTIEARRSADAYQRARSAVEMAEADAGARLSNAEIDHAAQLTMQGAHPAQAIIDAVRGGEDRVLEQNSAHLGFGSPGVPPAAQQAEMPVRGGLSANFDSAAAARYAAAREATLREKERFGRGPVGEVLARGRGGAPNTVLDADVPARFFTGRPSEPAQVQAYFNAVGGEAKGVAAARDYLVSDLRRTGIIDPDGTLNAGRFATWQHRRGETIKLFPGLDAEFKTAEAAQRALDDVQAAHAGALKEFQAGVAKHFLNEEPARAVEKTLGSADRVKLMNQAIGRVHGNADAMESLKAHVVDYMLDRLTSSAKATEGNAARPNITDVGSLRADAFKDWIGDNKPWLRRLFGGQGMQNLEMVGADLRRQQLRTIATAGSPTVERGVSAAQHGATKQHIPTVMAIIGEKIAETGAHAVGLSGVVGLAAEALGAGLPVLVHTMRQRGIATVNDLLREAMLHPSIAKELMARTPKESVGAIAQRRIAHAMQGVIAAQSMSSEKHE